MTLRLASGSMYVLTSKASGKIDAASDGTHVRHGVPQSPEPQLTLVVDVLLDAAEVSELHRRVAAQFSGEHDGGSGGFALDPATGLRGKRLVRLGSSCCGRGPAEKAKEAHACLTEMRPYAWRTVHPPNVARLAAVIRWFGGEAKKQPRAGERGALILELGRLACSAANELQPEAEATPQPSDEDTARAFLGSEHGQAELRRMCDTVAAACEEEEEATGPAGAEQHRAAAALAAKQAAAAEAKAAKAVSVPNPNPHPNPNPNPDLNPNPGHKRQPRRRRRRPRR